MPSAAVAPSASATSAETSWHREEVAIDLGKLPGQWHTKSAKEGHWTLDDKQQLYVSTMDFGDLDGRRSPTDRAGLALTALKLTFDKLGSHEVRLVTPDELAALERTPEGILGCVVAQMPHAEGRSVACAFAVPSKPAVLTVELSLYGDVGVAAFLAEAMKAVAAARNQVEAYALERPR